MQIFVKSSGNFPATLRLVCTIKDVVCFVRFRRLLPREKVYFS